MLSNSQKEPLAELKQLAASNRQSILIEGPSGCGKTYLCKQYANMLGIDDFSVVAPKVADIREALDSCLSLQNRVLLAIENLDLGVAGASYTLLKSLEEPLPNVYILITCRNMQAVPDTIISRSAIVTVSPPTLQDIDVYGKEKDTLKFNNVSSRLVWQCVRSFSDADAVLDMNVDEINYYESLAEVCKFKESVSSTIWKISHYDSGKDCNIELAIRSIVELMHNSFVTRCGIDCIRDLTRGRIAQHAVLAKFVFNAKYCE